jgi:hypothetical protein
MKLFFFLFIVFFLYLEIINWASVSLQPHDKTHQSSKEHMNSAKHAVNWDYKIEDMILLYNSQYKNNNTAVQKLEFWWLRSYKVIKANSKRKLCLSRTWQRQKTDTVSEFRLKSYVLHHLTVNHEYN